ncbi:MAG: hypothetical protein CL724_07785 [Chloroflexi bacterium]|nr:hypothetical protein [Chloroflexota bacterium]
MEGEVPVAWRNPMQQAITWYRVAAGYAESTAAMANVIERLALGVMGIMPGAKALDVGETGVGNQPDCWRPMVRPLSPQPSPTGRGSKCMRDKSTAMSS